MSEVPRYVLIQAKNTLKANDTVILASGEKYLVPRGWLGMRLGREAVKVVKEDISDLWHPYDISIDLTNKSLLVQRASGFGDMLWMSAVLKYIKDKYPSCKIGYSCSFDYVPILRLIPNIDKVVPIPVQASQLKNYDYHLSFMDSVENRLGEETDENSYEAFYKTLGAADVSDEYKRPYVKDITTKDIGKGPIVGIQPLAQSQIRDLPRPLVIDFIKEMNKRGYHVIMFTNKNEHRLIDLRNVVKDLNVSCSFEHSKDGDIYDSCKVLKSCEWLLTPDSAFAHIGPALGVKTISIYGPFAAESRMKYYLNNWAIDTRPSCRCRLHTPGICPYGITPSPCMDVDFNLIMNIIN